MRVANIVDMADAVRIGTGAARIPSEWIDLLSSNEVEGALWKAQEFRREL